MSQAIHQGSILDVEADCIVNAANSFLRHGAGLAAAIAQAAAPKAIHHTGHPRCDEEGKAWWEEQHNHPLIATGNVGVTSAGRLPFKGIIHAVGPIWAGGHSCERALLRMAYANACAAAHQRGWKSIAFPAISAGIFGVPIDIVAKYAASATEPWAIGWDVPALDITFALTDPEHVAAFERELA
jgi:O-acetyl-ADP-ribose deacetylase (regulator of RNase III)